MTDFLQATQGSGSGQGQDDQTAVGEITDVVNDLGTEFRDRDTLYSYIESILFRDIPVRIPRAYQKTAIEIHSPLPIHIANTVVAALTVNDPKVQFQPTGFGDSYQENATQREKFFAASWVRQQQEAKRRLFRTGMYSLVTKGEAVFKTLERTKSAWVAYDQYSEDLRGKLNADPHLDQESKDRIFHGKTEEFKRTQPYPITTTVVPPSTFRYIRTEDGLSFACEVKQVPYFATLATFNHGLDSKARVVPEAMGLPRTQWHEVMGRQRLMTLCEAWTPEEVFYILVGPGQEGSSPGSKLGRGTLVKRMAHDYGDAQTRTLRGPYFQALGVTTDSALPDRAGLSVLFGFLDLFPYLDSLLTIQSNNAFWTGFAAFKRIAPPGGTLPPAPYGVDGSEEEPTRIEPGTIYPYDIAPIEQPRAGAELDKAIGIVREFLALALPPVVQGLAPGASGYQDNQAAYHASLMWDPVLDNAEIALADRVGFESWLIENAVGEAVYVWGDSTKTRRGRGQVAGDWLMMDGSITKGVHRYQVKLDPKTPANRVIEIRTHAELLAQRLETREDAITDLGGNPDEVERSWRLYDLKQDPAIAAKLRQRTFEELSTIDQKAMGGAEAAAAANVGSPVGGTVAPPGGALGSVGQVATPGQGMPIAPTPPGSPAGMPPGIPSMPQNAEPMVGQ